MKLRELNARFLVATGMSNMTHAATGVREVDRLQHAHGLQFICPACKAGAAGRSSPHHIVLWFSAHGVPHQLLPNDESHYPGRWLPKGTGVDDLSLGKFRLKTGCGCSGSIENGAFIPADPIVSRET